MEKPHKVITTTWEPDEIREACEKSRAALLNLSHDLRINLANVENLFLITTYEDDVSIFHVSYGVKHRAWEWGSRDMMFDFRDTTEQRMAILMAAAHLTGRAVHLLLIPWDCTHEKAWLEALSLAADHDTGPSSLLIQGGNFGNTHGLLSVLKKNKRLKHLSLQCMKMSNECVEVLGNFTSLTTLHLEGVKVSEEFVVKLADLHPSHSPLSASLHRLHIHCISIDWRRSTGFLRHWPKLKELSLLGEMTEEELMGFMDHLAPPKKGAETAGSTPSSPPQLYSLRLGYFRGDLSRSATAVVLDALSRSSLPFFEMKHVFLPMKNPAVEAQLWRNQRNFMLGSELKRVPATSIRLFICGDPFAGKTTLVSTMRSMYGRKRDRARALFTGDRTQGIEVQAIKKQGIRVSLWDMAGQQEFHAFHDCMFPDIGTSSYQFPSMFMFVWSPMDSENSHRGAEKTVGDFQTSFRYWLRFLASKSRQSIIPLRVIVVFTRADQMEFVTSALIHSIDSLRSDFEGVIDILHPPFHVDAKKKDSVKAIAEFIFSDAKDMLRGIQMYDILAFMEKHIVNSLITICAQPAGVQGVRLVESVIRPDCCCDLKSPVIISRTYCFY